jgi:predicted molibdopterin-dependent oxidoreductase YjgC
VAKQKGICQMCTLGCGFIAETAGEELIEIEFDFDDPNGQGALCAKGNSISELLTHPKRLIAPIRDAKAIRWEEALPAIGSALAQLRDKSGADAIGLVLSGDATCEEVALAQAFSPSCLKSKNLDVFFPTNDYEVLDALARANAGTPRASLQDIRNANCIVAVGDPFATCPVISRRVLDAKQAARGNSINCIAGAPNMTTRFADAFLEAAEPRGLLAVIKCLLGTAGENAPAWQKEMKRLLDKAPLGPEETAAAARIAERFTKAKTAVVLLGTGNPLAAKLAAVLARIGGDSKGIHTSLSYGNSPFIFDGFPRTTTTRGILEHVQAGKVKGLVVLGADIVAGCPDVNVKEALGKLELLIAAAPFRNRTTEMAHFVLPSAIWQEKSGTAMGGHVSALLPPPGGAKPYGDIMNHIAVAMETRLQPADWAKVERSGGMEHEDIGALVEKGLRDDFVPRVSSTATRFSDGSITDNVSWRAAVEGGTQR